MRIHTQRHANERRGGISVIVVFPCCMVRKGGYRPDTVAKVKYVVVWPRGVWCYLARVAEK